MEARIYSLTKVSTQILFGKFDDKILPVSVTIVSCSNHRDLFGWCRRNCIYRWHIIPCSVVENGYLAGFESTGDAALFEDAFSEEMRLASEMKTSM